MKVEEVYAQRSWIVGGLGFSEEKEMAQLSELLFIYCSSMFGTVAKRKTKKNYRSQSQNSWNRIRIRITKFRTDWVI